MDELWSFVLYKDNTRWVWLVICRRTRQVLAVAVGDRSQETCQRLWNRIPAEYRKKYVYTDFWEAYACVVPHKQHRPSGKDAGETNHVERFNNTLRQRLARFVRKTLSFSKCPKMHWWCLLLFLHDYNRYCIKRFNLV
jgi:insertion element IS1 protein InsB